MGIIKQSAEWLDRSFVYRTYEDRLNIVDRKTDLFNLSTVAMIASMITALILGIFGFLSALAFLVLAGCFLFARAVIEESYNVRVPVLNVRIPDWMNDLKPDPLLKIGNWVIFYKPIPRSEFLISLR